MDFVISILFKIKITKHPANSLHQIEQQQKLKLTDITSEYFDYSLPSNKYYWLSIKDRYNDLMFMCRLLNIDEKIYNLIKDELPLGLDSEIVKNQDNFYLDEKTNKFLLKGK